ncbi:TrkH family potassium uptake protein [Sulfitobacter faviae]|uniref:TrkH family potassium uptake protein n=1 Tax=Sulfitobacter faviae TaxID=1775881 RepID=UPI00398D60AF
MAIRPASFFRSGSSTVMTVARPRVIALTLGKHAPIFGALCLPPGAWALAERDLLLALVLLAPVVLSGVVHVAVRSRPLPDDLRGMEAMMTVALVFLIAALLTTPAFVTLGMPPIDAFFEAVSGITTTGLTVAQEAESWPFAGHVLRGWMQWCGGLVIATAVLALLLPRGRPARRLGRVDIQQGDRISSTREQARQLLTVYSALTLVMVLLTMLVIPDWREALVLTLAAISTAGFSPRPDSLASYSPLGQGMVILSCVLGAISLLVFVFVGQGRHREAWKLRSVQRVLVAIAVALVIYLAAVLTTSQDRELTLYAHALNLISGLTTAGFSTGPVYDAGPALLILLLAMLWGGDAGSTAGGLKLSRLHVCIGAVVHAVQHVRLTEHAIAPLRHSGRPVSTEAVVSLLALVLIYFSFAGLLWFHFVAHGYPPLPALFDTISALSTVGLSTGAVGADMPGDLKLSVAFAMWLGRLEFIAVLALLLPRSWTRPS